LSEQAQRSQGFVVERLDSLDVRDNTWHEIVVEDRRAGPAETAACRLDFSEWLARLPDRRRKIALTLANGETTAAAAKRFRVTSARISQLRNWFRKSWLTFQGEAEAESPTRLAVA
jgi:hypothetical protein